MVLEGAPLGSEEIQHLAMVLVAGWLIVSSSWAIASVRNH